MNVEFLIAYLMLALNIPPGLCETVWLHVPIPWRRELVWAMLKRKGEEIVEEAGWTQITGIGWLTSYPISHQEYYQIHFFRTLPPTTDKEVYFQILFEYTRSERQAEKNHKFVVQFSTDNALTYRILYDHRTPTHKVDTYGCEIDGQKEWFQQLREQSLLLALTNHVQEILINNLWKPHPRERSQWRKYGYIVNLHDSSAQQNTDLFQVSIFSDNLSYEYQQSPPYKFYVADDNGTRSYWVGTYKSVPAEKLESRQEWTRKLGDIILQCSSWPPVIRE